MTLQPIQQATTPGFGLIAVSPDGQTVYVADVRNNYVYGFNVSDPNHPIAYNSIGTGSQKESSPITALSVGPGSNSTNQVYIGNNNGIDSCSSNPSGPLFNCPGNHSISAVPLAIVLHGNRPYTTERAATPHLFKFSSKREISQ